MSIFISRAGLLSSVVVAVGLSLTGCMDNDYNFDEVDGTIGVGSDDGLVLPVSSTDTIRLSDVLDLDGNDCIEIDAVTKDYVFRTDGDDVNPSHPMVEITTLADAGHESRQVVFDVPQVPAGGVSGEITLPQPVRAEGSIQILNYKGDVPDGLDKLVTVDADETFRLTLTFSRDMKTYVRTLNALTVTFPEYMELDGVRVDGSAGAMNGQVLELSNVATSANIVITGRVTRLNFDGNDALKYEETRAGKVMALKGDIELSASFAKIVGGFSQSASFNITGDISIGDFAVKSVTGFFNPEIDMPNLGDVDITGVPDFLMGENVVVDVYNPMISLTIYNDMEIGGFVSGALTAVKDGRTTTVEVPEMEILPRGENKGGNAETRICICRDEARMTDAEKERFDKIYSVPELSKLLYTIPDHISFSAHARANNGKLGYFELGKSYTVKPSYGFEAPLAFGSDASICYNDTIDDLNEDLKDLDLAKDTYVEVTATIENRVPFNLTVKAEALGVDGKKLGEDRLKVDVDETIIASADGKNSTETPIVIRVTQPQAGALKDLDAIAVAFVGDHPADGGVRLNSEKNFIIARDIKVKLKGKVIVSTDD